jgi:hypothetical protein
MFITGILLFWSSAFKAYESAWFRAKLVMLLLAGINALAFEYTSRPSIAEWDASPQPPIQARMAGWISLILWAGIITAGRTMAYTF